uniref:tRNA lysidine(34) synthetase TilS n=1 Tax=Candidatus Synechococcus spongiarum TaxID=431041 RepID=UPI000471D691
SGSPGQRAPSTPSWSRWHHRLHKSLLTSPDLLPSGASLLVAVSGGQDSLCLLRLLQDLQRLHHWSLQVFHGDHRWRPDSGANAAHVQSLCAAWGLPCHLEVAPGRLPGEAAARQWRYGRAIALCRHLGCSQLVTGHTATDRAETLLFHLCRGSGSRGLGSLRPQRPLAPGLKITRPLLHFSRQDTLQCCQALRLPIWPDASNDDQRLTRNRIRQRVLPELEHVNSAAMTHMAACAQQLAEESDLLDQLAREALDPMAARKSASLSPQALAALPRPLASRCLALWIEDHTGWRPDRQQLNQLLRSLNHPGIMAPLGRGWRLRWRRGCLHLQRGNSETAYLPTTHGSPSPPADPE